MTTQPAVRGRLAAVRVPYGAVSYSCMAGPSTTSNGIVRYSQRQGDHQRVEQVEGVLYVVPEAQTEQLDQHLQREHAREEVVADGLCGAVGVGSRAVGKRSVNTAVKKQLQMAWLGCGIGGRGQWVWRLWLRR